VRRLILLATGRIFLVFLGWAVFVVWEGRVIIKGSYFLRGIKLSFIGARFISDGADFFMLELFF
jgi:hypothetical protein